MPIFILALIAGTAIAFLKLGALSVMVSMLWGAVGTGAGLIVILAGWIIWLKRRK